MLNIGSIAKAIIAALVAGLTVLGKALRDNNGHLHAGDYIAAAVAFLIALGAVYTVPNVKKAAVAYNPGPNVTQSYINPQYTADLEQRAQKPRRDPDTGRFMPKAER